MIFDTHLNDLVCQCRVTHYVPPTPVRIAGKGWEHAVPAEVAEFEYEFLNEQGVPDPYLNSITINQEVEERLLDEYTRYRNQIMEEFNVLGTY